MKIYYSYKERLAGLFILLALLAIVVFMVGAAIENRWLEQRIPYHTHIVRGDGLRTGSPVLLSGIQVGEVGKLSIMDDNRIDVEILIRKQHASRVRVGTVAEVKRLLGIGEKRIYLVSSKEMGEVLPSGALLTANEPVDILDALSNLDLGKYITTMDRAVSAMEVMLVKLEEKDRLERMVEAFDQMAPTMERLNHLLASIDGPLSDMLNDKNIKETFKGTSKVFNDPNTAKAMESLSSAMEPKRTDSILKRLDSVLKRLDSIVAENGNLQGALKGADKILNDPRADKLLASIDKLTDTEKLERLVDNMAIVADEFAKIGPQIPTISKELVSTLREAVIVLKALQKTWLLDEEAKEVIKELKKKKQ